MVVIMLWCVIKSKYNKYSCVIGFGIMCKVYTSNLTTFVTHKIYLEWQIDMRLLGIIEPIFLYHPWKSKICIPISVVYLENQLNKIGCVNYVRFPKSSHTWKCQNFRSFSRTDFVLTSTCTAYISQAKLQMTTQRGLQVFFCTAHHSASKSNLTLIIRLVHSAFSVKLFIDHALHSN